MPQLAAAWMNAGSDDLSTKSTIQGTSPNIPPNGNRKIIDSKVVGLVGDMLIC